MTPTDLAALVRAAATAVLRERGLAVDALPARIDLARPRRPAHGDYATSVALCMAKRAGVAAVELADWLAGDLGARPGIARAEVAGPGFVNVRLAAEARGAVVGDVLHAGARYGTADELAGRSIAPVRPVTGPVWPAELRAARVAALGTALVNLLVARGASAGPPWPGDAFDTSAESVGLASAEVRYALVRVPAGVALRLDLDLLASPVSENPGYEVRYTHACLAGLLRQAADCGLTAGRAYRLLDRPEEAALIDRLASYPAAVATAARRRRPDRLARHLEALATDYHRFATVCRVLPMGDEPIIELYRARLALCAAARQVLGNGLGLLGVTAPERL